MPIRNKPRDFHSQLCVWNKDAPTGVMTRGCVISVHKREVELKIYESKQIFLRKKRDGHPRLQGKDFESHVWVINLLDVGRKLAIRKLLQPLKRPANVLEEEFTAPDKEDRFIQLKERKWYFDFQPNHLRDLNDDGEIDLTIAQAEAIIKRTDGELEQFSFSD